MADFLDYLNYLVLKCEKLILNPGNITEETIYELNAEAKELLNFLPKNSEMALVKSKLNIKYVWYERVIVLIIDFILSFPLMENRFNVIETRFLKSKVTHYKEALTELY